MLRLPLILAAFAAPLALLPAPSAAQDTPLLMEGKSRLYQRVLMRERALGADTPGGEGREPLAPLMPLYVYERDGDWLRVGRGDRAARTFWIPEAAAVDWHQNIVVTFEGGANLDRLLFFDGLDSVYDAVEAEDPAVVASRLREQAETAAAGGASHDTIVALGPRETVDLRHNLYVMPILESEEAAFENGALVNLLKVAVARAEPDGTPIDEPFPDRGREDFRAAVAFVVDTTRSMQPYIDGTGAALEAMFRDISGSLEEDAVSFGLIGYRDNLAAAPGLEYAVRTFATLEEGADAGRFLAAIRTMEEARESSRHFREDSYAAVEHAISNLDWRPYDARFIVLVTDAGPREVGDELSQTGLSGRGLATLATERLGAAVAVMHLLSPDGAADHDRARLAYSELTLRPNQEPLYFPVEGADTGLYREGARRLAELIVEQVSRFRAGADPVDFADESGQDDRMASALGSAARTMQLAYLGRIEGARAPDVFEAYVADRAFERPTLKPLSIRLLLTKNQLSDLDEALKLIIRKAEENVINPDEFFHQVLGAAADMSRRPEDVAARADEASLAEVAAIEEYLEGLPYTSRIMQITESDWLSLSISEQQLVVNELYDKVERYRRYNEATDQWVDYLGAGGGPDSLVYPMVLDDLP